VNNLNPIQWALRPLKNYAKFSGRAARAEFWWFFLFTMVIYFAVILAMGATVGGLASINPGSALSSGAIGILGIVVGLFWLALFIPMLAVQIRRLHDINRTGWWLGGFWLLYVVYLVLIIGIGFRPAMPGVGSAAAAAIIALAFFAYSIVLLVFFCLPGTRGANRYGDDPYGADVEQVFA